MKHFIGIMLWAAAAVAQQPQIPLQDGQIMTLWPGQPPGALGTADTDIPTLTVYLPRTTTRKGMTAVIVCPGGSYVSLAMNHEGRQVANYLNSRGIAAFVLKYRLGPRYHHPIELGDRLPACHPHHSRQESGRMAHRRPIASASWASRPGGTLASSASTHFDAGKRRFLRSDRTRRQPPRFRRARLSRR